MLLPLPNAENPPFNAGNGTLRQRQVRVEKPCELAIQIGLAQPRGHRISVMLVGTALVHCKGVLLQGGVDLLHG